MARPDKISRKIAQILQAQHTLVAPQIVAQLKEMGVVCNKTSVYRALERMSQRSEVCRHMFGGQTASYELRDHHHDHLVCNQCGQVVAVPCINEYPEQMAGFQVEHHHLTLFGVCANCQPQTETLDQ